MDYEAIIWAAIFFGADILILAFLLYKALQADREERARVRSESRDQSA